MAVTVGRRRYMTIILTEGRHRGMVMGKRYSVIWMSYRSRAEKLRREKKKVPAVSDGARLLMRLCRPRLKCDGTRSETRFRLSAKRTSPFKSAGASVLSTTGSQGVRIRGINAGYTMFRGSVKSTGYPLHSPVYPSLPLPCVTLCHYISTGLYHIFESHAFLKKIMQ
jgi:hypothetical protein